MANLVDMRDVSFTRGNRCIFDNISLTVPRGKITAIMGPSGIGSFDRFFWQEEPLWRLIFEAGEAGRGAPVQVRALEQWMIPNKLENVI